MIDRVAGIRIGPHSPFILFAGPCQIESLEHAMMMSRALRDICGELGIPFVYKSSFDKANRTKRESPRGVGLDEGLDILLRVSQFADTPVMTDVHTERQALLAGPIVSVLQIPALLSRQTDLLIAAGRTGKVVNIKKGQFMAPDDVPYAIDKARRGGASTVLITERGTSFGHHDLVVDFRGLRTMAHHAPVVFDATHSAQRPGNNGGSTGGDRDDAILLARAAVAVGVSGVFIECHQDPDNAPSDGPSMLRLDQMKGVLQGLRRIDRMVKDI